MRIDIETVWRFRKPGQRQPAAVMFSLLKDIHETGKITVAASRHQMSYRHVWSLVNDWSGFFGTAVVERSKGRGTKLTGFGEKLVWAGRRLEARLGPQLENLAQELVTELNGLLQGPATIIRMHASHGFAVSKLRELLNADGQPGVDIRYVSNQLSLIALAHGNCDLAGVHLPRGDLRERGVAACRDWIDDRTHRVIGFATREMGLMVKRGNPLRITTVEALVNPEIRFVNRDPDSGTRWLFDQIIAQHRIDVAAITGYQQAEFTHAAVAAYVASDMADVAFGVEAAARQFGLDFVRLLTEDYYFVCREALLAQQPMRRVMAVLRSSEFHEALDALPGYAASGTGVVHAVREVFGGEDA